MNIKQLLQTGLDMLFPRTCPVCGDSLDTNERFLCTRCLAALPRTYFEETEFNVMEQLFAGIRVERATAYFYYEREDPYAAILHDIKYRNLPQLGTWLAQRAAKQIAPSGFFQDVDALVPVPIHADKLEKRGYNQARFIAKGIEQELGIPIVDAIDAVKPHATQTRKSQFERMQNVKDLYRANPDILPQLRGKHVLVIDDVVTTGATLITCAKCLNPNLYPSDNIDIEDEHNESFNPEPLTASSTHFDFTTPDPTTTLSSPTPPPEPDVKVSLFTLAAARLA